MLPPADLSAIGGIITASAVVGGGVGRHVGRRITIHRDTKGAEATLLQNLTWALTGKPADQWGPREPGLIEQMATLRAQFDAHVVQEQARIAAAELVLKTATDLKEKTS